MEDVEGIRRVRYWWRSRLELLLRVIKEDIETKIRTKQESTTLTSLKLHHYYFSLKESKTKEWCTWLIKEIPHIKK